MSRTNESKARERVHRLLPPKSVLHRQSMSGTLEDGTPDFYYEGPMKALWVEWKYTRAKAPRSPPKVTDLQASWLRRAHNNAVKVAVIEGLGNGTYRIFPEMNWDLESDYSPKPCSAKDVAAWIEVQCLHGVDLTIRRIPNED